MISMQMNVVDSVNSDSVNCLNLGSAVNYLPAMQEPQVTCGFKSWVRKIPWWWK